MKIYVDSNVFISAIMDEFGKGFEFMGLRSIEFLEKVLDCHYTILISNLVIKEISNITHLSFKEIESWLSDYKHKISIWKFGRKDILYAKKFQNKIEWDLVHASVAIRSKCEVICTWNVKDFNKVRKRIKIFTPEFL
jgi:predicted nucleic acid-binding protein